MAYSDWVQKHAKKHKLIVDKLRTQGYSKDKIIDYFDFENMKMMEEDFCPLYKKNQKCHDIESLNCYLCSCPNFRYSDEGITLIEGKKQFSLCSIESVDGRQGIYGEKIHQDCSGCSVPHHKSYVKKNFDYDWSSIMKKCSV